ncbi:MAG: CoA transferase [Comamonadaceae bacterium]|nr:MAG: CoA transferase [Comamonadaceae bacterium]
MPLQALEFQPEQRGPLKGIRVLDMSRLMAGNMMTLQFADFGAEVIKIESPGVGDTLRHWKEKGLSVWWKVYARNKKSVTLNPRHPSGVQLLARLIPSAHVLVESFRPGVLEAMGMSPEALWKINPKLVVVRISGWGQTGPYSQRPGFGTLVEGMSGFAAKNGFPDKPPALPNLGLADMVAGLSGFSAALIAVREAEKPDGRGQVVDVSLLEPLLSILGPDAAIHKVTGKVQPRTGNRTSITAPRNAYPTSDGQWMVLSASTQRMSERLLQAIGRGDMNDDPRFRTSEDRIANVEPLDEAIGAFVAERSLAENLAFFEAAQVTVGPVYDAAQVPLDAHVRDRGILVELPDADLGRVPMHNVVPRLSHSPGAIRSRAPSVGEHNREIYGDIGLDDKALDALGKEGAI